MATLKNKNIGVIITDHNVDETLAITDRTYLLFEGKILKTGSAEELAADEMVRKVYLGQHFELRRSPQLDKIRREQETAHPDSGPQTATPPPSGAAAAECPEGTTPAEAANNPDDRTEREATRDADRDGRE